MAKKPVRVQWDPERDLNLQELPYRSIQIGLSGEALERYAKNWIVRIEDITDLVHNVHVNVKAGDMAFAAAMLPKEQEYVVPAAIGGVVGIEKG
jgi:hypothetical protein